VVTILALIIFLRKNVQYGEMQLWSMLTKRINKYTKSVTKVNTVIVALRQTEAEHFSLSFLNKVASFGTCFPEKGTDHKSSHVNCLEECTRQH